MTKHQNKIASLILEYALKHRTVFYPDDISIVTEQPNDVGIAFNGLAHIGIIRRSNLFRPSTSPNANGRTIFGWALRDEWCAKDWLREYKESEKEAHQQSLFDTKTD